MLMKITGIDKESEGASYTKPASQGSSGQQSEKGSAEISDNMKKVYEYELMKHYFYINGY